MRLFEYLPEPELITNKTILEKPKFPVIDFHTHFGKLLLGNEFEKQYDTEKVIEKLKDLGIRHVVNSDGLWGDELDRVLRKTGSHPFFFSTFGSVDLRKFQEPDFAAYVKETIRVSVSKGIKGLKFWKGISLYERDREGKWISLDDDRMRVVWEAAAMYDLPVLLHIGDPVAFFRKVDRYNERYEELIAYPSWSFCEDGMPGFEDLMVMQENLVRNNPETTFIVSHVGSYSENLKQVSDWLASNDNMYIDFSVRLNELGRQPYSSKEFFEKFQDRIVFGTEMTPTDLSIYPPYYRFLESMDEYFDYLPIETDETVRKINVLRDSGAGDPVWAQGRWQIYGIGLSDKILKKIYYENAERLLNLEKE